MVEMVSNMQTTIACEPDARNQACFRVFQNRRSAKSHNDVCLRLMSHKNVGTDFFLAQGGKFLVQHKCLIYQ